MKYSGNRTTARLICMILWMFWVSFSGVQGGENTSGVPTTTPTGDVTGVNLLSKARSPYLRDCARQPVDWREWGAGAFVAARRENKPILLDLGVGWSHWSRTMDRENYSDLGVARILNEKFVCIKVDSDERPDIDGRYQRLYQLMNRGRSAGHPLIAFLTPDGDMFFAAPYLPRIGSGDRGFVRLVERIHSLWEKQQGDLIRQAKDLSRLFVNLPRQTLIPETRITTTTLETVHQKILAEYNSNYPGFGPAEGPRFPTPWTLQLLLERTISRRDSRDLAMARSILRAMTRGAISDPLEGGIHRYTTDGEWLQPRWEMLLESNAMHIGILCNIQQISPDPQFEESLHVQWDFIRERMSVEGCGGFGASLGADPSGGEGVDYWGWSSRQVDEGLPEDTAKLACYLWGIPRKEVGKNEARDSASLSRVAAPRRARTLEEAGKRFQRYSREILIQMRDEARGRLIELRKKRSAPPLDVRLFTAPNARLVQALWNYECLLNMENTDTSSDQSVDRKSPVQSINAILDCFERRAVRSDGLIAHEARLDVIPDEKAPAFLEDQTAWIGALLETYQGTGEQEWLDKAEKLSDRVLERFTDPTGMTLTDRCCWVNRDRSERSGTSRGGESRQLGDLESNGCDDVTTGPIALPLIVYEDSESPGEVSEFALQLTKLWRITGREDRRREAERILRPAASAAEMSGGAMYSTWSRAVANLLDPMSVHIVGAPTDPKTKEFLAAARRVYRPQMVIAVHSPGNNPPWLSQGGVKEDIPYSYIVGTRISPIIVVPEELETRLRNWGK